MVIILEGRRPTENGSLRSMGQSDEWEVERNKLGGRPVRVAAAMRKRRVSLVEPTSGRAGRRCGCENEESLGERPVTRAGPCGSGMTSARTKSNGEAKRILELRASIIKRAPDSGALGLGDLQIVHRQPVGTNQRKVLKLQLPPSPL